MAAAAASAPAAPRGTLVCASLTARSPQEVAAEVAAAAALGADVVELQVGCLEGFQPRRDLPVLLAQPRPLPVIVTYRFLFLLVAFSEDWLLSVQLNGEKMKRLNFRLRLWYHHRNSPYLFA